jgi:hypothetical protein
VHLTPCFLFYFDDVGRIGCLVWNAFACRLLNGNAITAIQNGAFADGDILFDWTGFEIPRGTVKLLGATIKIRSKGDAGSTVQAAGINLLFAKAPSPDATPGSLGSLNGPITNFASNDVIGAMPSVSTDTFGTRTLYQSTVSSSELVLEPNVNSGSDVGVDKYYIAGLATGAMNFTTTCNVDGVQATNQRILTVQTVDPRLFVAVGDVIHDENNRLMGTVASRDSTTQLTMAANLSLASVDEKKIYNINPVDIILHFSK